MAEDKSKSIFLLLKELDIKQREAVLYLLKSLQDGKILSGKDVGLLGIDLKATSAAFAYRFFGISKDSLLNWESEGCPRNQDGTFNLQMVHEWRVTRERQRCERDVGSKKEVKLQKEIELLSAKVNKANSETMLIKDHESMFGSWASSFKAFWAQAWRRNRHHFAMRSQEEIDVLFDEFGRQLMEIWAGSKDK